MTQAKADYDKLLAIDDSDPNDWQNYALILTRMKRSGEALSALENAVQKGGDPAPLHMMKGNMAYQNGQF